MQGHPSLTNAVYSIKPTDVCAIIKVKEEEHLPIDMSTRSKLLGLEITFKPF